MRAGGDQKRKNKRLEYDLGGSTHDFSHESFKARNGESIAKSSSPLYGAKLKDDLSGIEESTEEACIAATKEWENTENASWPVTEGPTVIKKDDTYYLFYSANDFRNPDYAVGYATSKSPLGPWEKQEGPIISRNNLPANGTGHGDIFEGKDKQLYYVLHTHNDKFQATPRRTGIVKLKFTQGKDAPGSFSIDEKSFYYGKEYVEGE